MASSSSVSIFDNYRFKSAFNEELYNSIVKNKKVIAECCIDLDEDEYPEVKEQIAWARICVGVHAYACKAMWLGEVLGLMSKVRHAYAWGLRICVGCLGTLAWALHA
ncbi:hypothetical protein PIB30_071895 [Stylosanthes scabra]|uniref:Uncharacterized protein n=1 Tax=Stylosanthes scabra TaxID=79078 RepID=A0ABU6ZMR8_9FABA|nr:hypothetical protein [Stylosanthes scabra]